MHLATVDTLCDQGNWAEGTHCNICTKVLHLNGILNTENIKANQTLLYVHAGIKVK